jgi:hypothetical protein
MMISPLHDHTAATEMGKPHLKTTMPRGNFDPRQL